MATSNRGQAEHGIEEIFKLIQRKGIKSSFLKKFEDKLNKHHKLKELGKEKLLKDQRLTLIQKKLIDLSHETFDIVYRWIEDYSELLKITIEEMQLIDNTVIEFALTEVFEHQKYTGCDKETLNQLLADRYLRIAHEESVGVYASLEVSLDESVEIIKTKCIKHLNSSQFRLDQQQVKSIMRKKKTFDFHSHISNLESSDEGDPFIFYAASIVYQHHIHVLCAAEEGLEEYVFYPSNLPSERSSCDHMFIGHLSENNYVSLESTKIKFLKQNEKEKLIREYKKKIEKLQEENRKSTEENLELRKEIEKYKKMVEELKTEFRETKIKNDKQFQLLNDKLDKLLSVKFEKSSLSNMPDSTHSNKDWGWGKGKGETLTEEKKSAQVAKSVQNNEHGDGSSNVTAVICKRKISDAAGKSSQNNEQIDKPNSVKTVIGKRALSGSAGKAKSSQKGYDGMPAVEKPELPAWKH